MSLGSHIQPGTAQPVERLRRGVLWVFEGHDEDGEPIERPIYMLPGQNYGLTREQLFNSPPQLQREIMEAWFRANYEPATAEIQVQLGAEPINHPSEQLGNEFTDPKTGDVLGGSELSNKLFGEAFVWLPKPPHDDETSRQEALAALDRLEAALRAGSERQPGIGDNHPPEPIGDAAGASRDAGPYALEAITEGRRALSTPQIDYDGVQQAQRRLLHFAAALGPWVAERGRVAGKTAEGAFWKAIGGGLGVLALGALVKHAPDLYDMAIAAVHALQKVLHP